MDQNCNPQMASMYKQAEDYTLNFFLNIFPFIAHENNEQASACHGI